MGVLSTLNSNKAKIFYFIAASFIICFALVYLRSYSPYLYELCTPINPQLDTVQTAVAETLSGNPMAVLSVLTTPLTILVAVVRLASTKLTTAKDQVTSLTTQANAQYLDLQNQYLTQIQQVQALKEDYASKFTSTFNELKNTIETNKALLAENSQLNDEIKQLREQLIAIDASI